MRIVECINCHSRVTSGYKKLSASNNTQLRNLFGLDQGYACRACIDLKQAALLLDVETNNAAISNLNDEIAALKRFPIASIPNNSEPRKVRFCYCARCAVPKESFSRRLGVRTINMVSHLYVEKGIITDSSNFLCVSCSSNLVNTTNNLNGCFVRY